MPETKGRDTSLYGHCPTCGQPATTYGFTCGHGTKGRNSIEPHAFVPSDLVDWCAFGSTVDPVSNEIDEKNACCETSEHPIHNVPTPAPQTEPVELLTQTEIEYYRQCLSAVDYTVNGPVVDRFIATIDAALTENRELREQLKTLRRIPLGEVWYWQGDGSDYPESLTCPVIMEASVLRDLLVDLQKANARLARYEGVKTSITLERYQGGNEWLTNPHVLIYELVKIAQDLEQALAVAREDRDQARRELYEAWQKMDRLHNALAAKEKE